MSNISINSYTVRSEDELLDRIFSLMDDTDYSSVTIMAGHFMLFFDRSHRRLVPGIFEDIPDIILAEQVRNRVGIFPTYTWDLGIRLGEQYCRHPGRSANLLLLVNDWQYVPDSGNAGDYRASFYKGFDQLPAAFASRLSRSELLGTNDVLASRRHSIAFPETWLRYRFQNRAAQLVKQGKLQKRYLDGRPGQTEVAYADTDGNSLPLISCGVTGCAGEIVEMISEAHKSGGRYLILLAPAECHAPIRTGVQIALSIYDLRGMKILVADPGGSGETSPDQIYGNGVNLSLFQS